MAAPAPSAPRKKAARDRCESMRQESRASVALSDSATECRPCCVRAKSSARVCREDLDSVLHLQYTGGVELDWPHRAAYIERHGMTVGMANEAYRDPDAVVFDPDLASKSGLSVRTIGYSPTAARSWS